MKKFVLLACLIFTLPMLAEAEIEEAFVAFATPNYFHCLKVLIKSVQAFSTRKIVAFGLNADIPFSTDEFPCLVKRRIDVDLKAVSAYHWKPKVLLESGVKYGIYVDSDLILNAGVDALFEICHQVDRYPVCPIHPSDPQDVYDLMDALEVKTKSMHYVHNDQIMFNESCRPFIEEWLRTGIAYQHLAVNHDEKVLNVLLWKHGATQLAESTDPYYANLNTYMNLLPSERIRKNYYMFHGCKDTATAERMLKKLVSLALN